MQQHDSNYFFVVAVMFKRDKLHRHPRPNHCRWQCCYSNNGVSKKSQGSCLLLLT